MTLREAWFFGGNEYWNLMYMPYTTMVLSYVLLGAALAPIIHYDRLVASLLAYFLGVGVAAHYLNEATSHRAGGTIAPVKLWSISLIALSLAVVIGLYYVATVTLWLLVFIAVETFFLISYNIRSLFNGRFHSDYWFAFSWGSMPLLTSYFVNALTLNLSSLLASVFAALTAMMQARLSRWVKEWRRSPQLNRLILKSEGDGAPLIRDYNTASLIWRPQSALKFLVLTVNIIALSIFLWRLAL